MISKLTWSAVRSCLSKGRRARNAVAVSMGVAILCVVVAVEAQRSCADRDGVKSRALLTSVAYQ
jgi:hypothetical protein